VGEIVGGESQEGLSLGRVEADLVVLELEEVVHLSFVLGGCQVHSRILLGIIKLIYFNSKYYWT
jgi:hypothetical protein